jgi:hypothetical protein
MATITIDPQTILNESREFVLELQGQVEDAINELETFIMGRITWVDFLPMPGFQPTPAEIIPLGSLPILTPAIFGAEFGDPLSEMNRFYGHNFIAPMLDTMQKALAEWMVAEGVEITDPTEEMNRFYGHNFIAPMLDTMQNTLIGWITSGGVGISDDVQNALWENNRQRRLQSLRDVNDVIHSKDAARGFAAFSGGPTGRDEYNQLVEYQRNDENLNHEITFKMAELAQQNTQFAVTQNVAIENLQSVFSQSMAGIFLNMKNVIIKKAELVQQNKQFAATQNVAIENLQSVFSQSMAGIFLNMKRLIIEKFKIECDQRIAEWRGKLDAILAGYNVAQINGQAYIAYQGLLEKQWEVLITQKTERTKALIEQAKAQNKIQLEAVQTLVGTLGAAISSALLQTNGIVVESKTTSATAK